MRTGFGLQQVQSLRQTLVMTPKLQQAIKVMQMTSMDLQQHVDLELQENIFLEEGQDLDLEEEIQGEMKELESDDLEQKKVEETEPEIRVEDFLDDSLPPFRAEVYEIEEGDEDRRAENAQETTFLDYLADQLTMLRLPPADLAVCERILGSLNADGFLAVDLEELAEEAGRDVDEVEEILRYVHTHIDPVGIGCRDRQEYFLVQMETQADTDPLAHEIAKHHYEDLLRNRIPQIAKALREKGMREATAARVEEAKQWFANLQLAPTQGFLEGFHGVFRYKTHARPVIPDVVVTKEEDEYVVKAVDESVPTLHLNRRYLNMLRNGAALAPDEKKFLEDYRQRARELIDSIHERGRTIENVAREIFTVQSGFLEHGIKHLKPLVLRDIAERLGKHESTISRATNGKYVQTPRGIFELKYFFSSALESSAGDMASSTSVRAIIGEIIQAEDPARPLSDQKLSNLLRERGFKVARRTVAKYREELGVPSSSQRKKSW
jgi:RNA polymerase sigma-54 factor